VPASTKLQEKYGDDVQVIFVECQGTSKDVYEAFAWKMKWMGNGAMWTTEPPIPPKGKTLPETALIGVDGQVVLQGNPGDFGKKFEEALAAEVKKAKDAPAGTPKELKKAWQLFAKGDVAGAIAECDTVGGDTGAAGKKEFVARANAKVARAKWLIDNGFVAAADKILVALAPAGKSDADLATKVSAQQARLLASDLSKEREADKAFGIFVSKVAKTKPFEPGNVQSAQSIAKQYSGTKTAARAERFVALSKVELNK
jgi:hypothetical protein